MSDLMHSTENENDLKQGMEWSSWDEVLAVKKTLEANYHPLRIRNSRTTNTDAYKAKQKARPDYYCLPCRDDFYESLTLKCTHGMKRRERGAMKRSKGGESGLSESNSREDTDDCIFDSLLLEDSDGKTRKRKFSCRPNQRYRDMGCPVELKFNSIYSYAEDGKARFFRCVRLDVCNLEHCHAIGKEWEDLYAGHRRFIPVAKNPTTTL